MRLTRRLHARDRLRTLLSRKPNPLERMTNRELEIDGVTIRVHELWQLSPAQVARPDLPVFVLIHGLGVSSRYFVPLAEQLAVHGRVVLVDLPGFAGLPLPDRPLDIPDHARFVRKALEQLDVPGSPVLIGHSMGTQVVVEMLASDPDYARYAMLLAPVLDPKGRTLPKVVWRFLRSAIWESPVNTLAAIAGYLRCPAGWITETMPRVMAYPMLDRLAGLPTRIAVVGGGRDRISTNVWQQSLVKKLTGAKVVTLPRAAHAMVVDHADQLAEEILQLIGQEQDQRRTDR